VSKTRSLALWEKTIRGDYMRRLRINLRRLIAIGIIFCLSIFIACENGTGDNGNTGNENGNETGNTNVKFINLEQYPVTVYRDSLRQNEFAKVAALDSAVVAAASSGAAGTVFYPTFHLNLFDIPGISVPYNALGIVTMIAEGKTTDVPISKLETIDISSAFIKVINNSSVSLTFRQGGAEKTPLGASSGIITPNQSAVYEITPGPSSGYSLMRNTTIPIDFPADFTEFNLGMIYVFTYNGTSLTLTDTKSVLQTIPPSAPENVNAVMVSSDSVRITWDAVYGTTSYRIYRAASAEGTYSSVGTSVTASYTDTSVSAGQAYYYKISALSNTSMESAQSAVVAVIMPPADVRVTAATANSVSLAWNAFSGASGYNIYRSGSEDGIYSEVNTAAVTDAEFTDTGLSLDADYWYKVSAIVDGAEGLLSGQIPASTSSVPGNVRVTAETAKSVSLAWNVVSDAGGYNVYRSGSENGIYIKVNTAAVTGTGFTDTGLMQDAIYWYKVSAIIDSAEGLLSSQIPASTSSVPGNVRVTAETLNSVSLAWNVVSEAGGYNVYRSDSENGIYSKVNTAAVTGTEFADTGLSQDAAYWYKVIAIIDGAEGLLSSQIPAFTSSAPGNVRVTAETVNSVSLAWDAVFGAGGYNVYRSDSENGTYNRINTSAVTGTAFTDTNVSAYTTYFYKVSTIINGIEGIQSNLVSAITVNMVPGSGLAEKLRWLQNNALSNADYIIEVTADESIEPTTLFYSNRTNIGITLRGTDVARTVSLSSNGAMFTVGSGVTLVLDNNITLQGRSSNNASLVNISGTLVMNTGSRITGNTSNPGGGVFVSGTGTFTMNGGEISGNTSSSGGGVFVSGSFRTGSDGGMYLYSSGTFTMNGGEISGNTSISGGGVYVGSGTFTMSGGTISGNTASSLTFGSGGGGVYVGGVSGNIGTFTKTGGTIYGYSASDTANSNVVKNSSGTVHSNRGHAVYAYYSSSVIKRRETTAGTSVNLSFNGSNGTFSGSWDY
jgi:fibronectin type 3 domain-containing protein